MHDLSEKTYQCPDERYPIDRAVHLGRLAAFDPRCRTCGHRTETGCLPLRLVEELHASWQEQAAPLFDDEGATGLLGQCLDSATSRRLAAAFSDALIEHSGVDRPMIVLAGDGRAATAELVAAASDGIRWAGCQVLETPSATAASLMFTQAHYNAHGAVLVGNANGELRSGSIRFFGLQCRPISAQSAESDINLEDVVQRFRQGMNRPARQYGTWRRGTAEAEYLATFMERFHALRPLRFVLDTTCAPLVRNLNRLLMQVGCRAYSPAFAAQQPPEFKHFGIWIDGDGERLRLFDENGQALGPVTTLALLVDELMLTPPSMPIVLEDDTEPEFVERLQRCGVGVARSSAARGPMHRTLTESQAICGGGPSGRFWIRGQSPSPLPDALQVLAWLLTLFSRSDRPISAVVSELPA